MQAVLLRALRLTFHRPWFWPVQLRTSLRWPQYTRSVSNTRFVPTRLKFFLDRRREQLPIEETPFQPGPIGMAEKGRRSLYFCGLSLVSRRTIRLLCAGGGKRSPVVV